MNQIQDAFFLNETSYLQLTDEEKRIIDIAAIKLKEWEGVILSFEKERINIVTNHPQYSFVIESKFPEDLTNKMIFAFFEAKKLV